MESTTEELSPAAAPTTFPSAAAAALPPPSISHRTADVLHKWRSSGIANHIVARPAECQILQEAYERLSTTTQRELCTDDRDTSATSTTPRRTEAIFVSSSEAGLGDDALLQSFLHQHVSVEECGENTSGCCLEIDCDRGTHPDPHLPILRALTKWVQARRHDASSMTTAAHHSDMFLAHFVQHLKAVLESKETRFLKDNVPEFQSLLEQYGSQTIPRRDWKAKPSSVSSFGYRTTASLYSHVKLATILRPAFAKFVACLASATITASKRRRNGDAPEEKNETPPVIVLFQKLHRGEEVLLDMLRFLLSGHDVSHHATPILVLVTYQRDPNNYMPACIDQVFEELRRNLRVNHTKIVVDPIERQVLARRLETHLHVEDDDDNNVNLVDTILADGCASWLIQKQLEQCVRDGSILWDDMTRRWEFCGARTVHKSPLEILGLHLLSSSDMQFLRIVSCFGMKTSRSCLVKTRASEDLNAHLALAVERGFLVASDEIQDDYCFVSEFLRDFIYHDIPSEDRPRFHHQIAENLWLSLDLEELNAHLVVVVENLLAGRTSLPDSKRRRAAVAQLCLRAGEVRAQVSAYQSAYFYFSSAIELLTDDWDGEYELCLALYSATCEAAFCLAMWDVIMRLSDVVIERARTFHDALRAHISRVHAIGTQGGCLESIQYSVSLLSKLGEPLRVQPSRRQAFFAMHRTSRRMRGLTDEYILRLPAMSDPKKVSAMRVLNALLPFIFNADYLMIPLIVEKMIKITLEFGTSALSGIAFAMMAAIMCWDGFSARGQRYGALALRLAERYQVDAWTGRVATLYYASVLTWRNAFRESLEPMHAARQVSLACGDIEFAMINANLSCVLELDLAPIPELIDTIREYQEIMTRFGQAMNLLMLQPALLILLSCSGRQHGEFTVVEDAHNRTGQFEEVRDSSSLVRQWCQYARMFVAYLFDDIEEAARASRLCPSLIDYPVGSADIVMPCMVDGLLALEQCRRSLWKVPLLIRRIRRRIRQLYHFAASSPANFLGKLHLLKAELASVLGRHDRAHIYYTSAIVMLRDSGFYVQLGLANELAGKHFVRRKDTDHGEQFLEEAVRVYKSWGAHAKAEHLATQMKLL